MKQGFRGVRRVIVANPNEGHEPLRGRTGIVARKLISTPFEAWVEMDDPLPDELRRFSRGDRREKHVCLHSEECERADAE